MRIIIQPVVDPSRELQLNWIEAESYLARVVSGARAEAKETVVVAVQRRETASRRGFGTGSAN